MLFHGYLSSKEVFLSQIEYFSAWYRVTAIDFAGFGESPLMEAFSVSDYAEWTKKVLSLLKIETPHVIAHSFGCRVAIKIAASNSTYFDKILLIGPAGVILPRRLSYKIKVKTYKLVKKIFPNYAETHFGSKEYRMLSPIMKESYKKIVNEDLREDAKRVKNQVLILEGKRDTTTPKKEAEAYLKCFTNGRIKEIEGGHFAFLQFPIAFNLTAEEFFK